jgi:uncharacterized protein (DUF2141 family)
MKFSVLLATALALSPFPSEAALYAAAQSGIRVVVKGLRDDGGRVGCSLFNGPDGFPREKAKQFHGMWVPKHDRIAVCNFVAVPAATYDVGMTGRALELETHCNGTGVLGSNGQRTAEQR